MKLYYSPGACSLASHIVLREVADDFELEKVDLATLITETGADFTQVNPKGYVPALRLDDGQVLTEGSAIVQFIADQHPESGLAPKSGLFERARMNEHLNYISSEVHTAFGPLFSNVSNEDSLQAAKRLVRQKMGYFETLFSDGRLYLLGGNFTVADAYLFTVASWTTPTGIGLDAWPKISAFVERVSSRVKVQDALRAEELQ